MDAEVRPAATGSRRAGEPMSSARFTRRRVLGLGAAAGAVAVSGVGIPWLASSEETGRTLRSDIPLPKPYQVPLPIPPVLRPVADGDVDRYEIVQREAAVALLPGVPTRIWGYDGRFPGPTIISRSGRPTVVRHRNELPVPTAVHLHGGHTPADSDGYPTDLILPVGTTEAHPSSHPDPLARPTTGVREYRYPLGQRAATLWYHDHRMDFTGPSVWRGLAGFHLVHDAEEDALPLPDGDRDIPLMIVDRSFAADGALKYPALDPALHDPPGVIESYRPGVLGDVILVNGAAWPTLEVDAVRYRFRVLNASNARRYRLSLEPSPPDAIVQIGSDGGLLERPVRHSVLDVAPGERFDIVIDFAGYPVGQTVTLANLLGTGPTRDVMRFHVARAAADDSAVPERLSTIERLDPRSARRTRDLHFANTREHTWTVNGKHFDPARTDIATSLGDVEVWRFATDFHHPIHLHLVHFQVLARNSEGRGPFDSGWKDTVNLRPAEEISVITRFTGYPGRYVLHCHNLEHEDMAMMLNVQVG
jgi:spore coat protein A